MNSLPYDLIRDSIQQGDIIAFGGKGFISGGIKLFTHSPVSHIGIVLETKVSLQGEAQDGRVIQIIESTTLNGKNGVQINRASERIANYDGNVWWAPLADQVRKSCDWARFYRYLLKQTGKPYDYLQCLGMVWEPLIHIPLLGRAFMNPRDAAKVYCSELACQALEVAGAIEPGVNPSETSPEDLMKMAIYKDLYQMKGRLCDIPKFNTVAVLI